MTGKKKEKLSMSEKTLFALFDYQQFENDSLLKTMINETPQARGDEISDDDLSQINAAGESWPAEKERREEGAK